MIFQFSYIHLNRVKLMPVSANVSFLRSWVLGKLSHQQRQNFIFETNRRAPQLSFIVFTIHSKQGTIQQLKSARDIELIKTLIIF